MAIVQISIAPSRELYESVRGQVDVEELRGHGLVLHAASELPTGEVRIVDVFESQAALERAAQEAMAPAFAGAGMDIATMPVPEASETFELVR